MRLLKQSSTAQGLTFLMVQSSDHITPATGLAPTVTLSKAGAAFAAPAGAVSEIGNGWYRVAGNATDTNTLGSLILHATAAGADPTDREYAVVAFDPQSATNLGLSDVTAIKGKTDNLPAAPASETNATTNTSNILAAIGNQGSAVYCQVNIPPVLERPDAGSETFKIIVIMHDEGNVPTDIDAAGNPTVLLYNSATGTSRAGRLSAWTHPSTGRYEATYTNSVGDPLEHLQWEISGTVGGVVRRAVPSMQLTDVTAVDFTAQDRAMLDAIEDRVTISLPSGVAPGSTGGLPVVDGNGRVKAKVEAIDNDAITGNSIAASGVAKFWDALTSGITTNGSIGKLAKDVLTSLSAMITGNKYTAAALENAPTGSGGGGGGAGGNVSAYLLGKMGSLRSSGCGCSCRGGCGCSRPFRLYRGDTREYPIWLEGSADTIVAIPEGATAQLWNDLERLPDPAFEVTDPRRYYGVVQLDSAYWAAAEMVNARGNHYLRLVDEDGNILTQIDWIINVPGEG